MTTNISPSSTAERLHGRNLELKDKLVIFVGAGSSPEKRDITPLQKSSAFDR